MEHCWMIVFTKFLILGIQYFSCRDAIRSCGPTWWSLMCSAETTNLVKWWFEGKIIWCFAWYGSMDCCNCPPTLRRPSWSTNATVSWENWWPKPLDVPSSRSFLVDEKLVVPSSYSKSEPDQDLVWRGWLLACRPWDVCSYLWIF